MIAAAGLIGACFLPWTEYVFQHVEYSGFRGKENEGILTVGSQWIPHTLFAMVSLLLFAAGKEDGKNANILVAMLNLVWAIKNFILFTICSRPGMFGECPQAKPGLILVVVFSVIIQVMTFLSQYKTE